MKLEQRHVNLILGILSFILLISFIFIFYAPKHDKYSELVNELDPLQQKLTEAEKAVNELPKLKELLHNFEKEEKIKQKALSDSGGLNISNTLITLESIADRTQIDLALSSSQNGFPDEDTTEDEVKEDNQENSNKDSDDSDKDEEEYMNDTNDTEEQEENLNDLSYNVIIKGEYRSIMVFLFELRSLEYPAKITNFELSYNDGDSKDEGFPLTAKFNIDFKEGVD